MWAGSTPTDPFDDDTLAEEDDPRPITPSLSPTYLRVSSSPVVAPPDDGIFTSLSTSGNQIVDASGQPFRITGVNWFGFETGAHVFHGLWSRGYKAFLDQVVSEPLGFNTLRIPFSNEALRAGATTNGINFFANPELQGLSPLKVLDEVIRYCGTIGLRVFLDRHSSKADGLLFEDIWYIPGDSYYTEQRWIDDWVMLALRYRGNPTVVGADLFNEPKRTATWAAWRPAAQRCANAIHAVNSDWLIIVEGTGEQFEGENSWWGGNLVGVATDPVQLDRPNKLVYSAHDYPSTVYEQDWFNDPAYPANLDEHWRTFWGYIFEQNIAPIIGKITQRR